MRKLGTNPVSSQPMSADMLKNDARPILVWLEGTALHTQTRRAGASLTLESGGRIVTAYAPAALPPNLRGARVRVSGVWNAPPAAWEQAPPGLWLAKNEVQVLERSPPGVPAT